METIALLQKLHAIRLALESGEVRVQKQLIVEAEEITRQIQRYSEEQRRRDSRLSVVHLQT
ncbi:MAG TPA: hypothetical protein VK716_01480 [Terracidiphilus sp.]|nr:hypothetical protein [Terracidiphilus sp.]